MCCWVDRIDGHWDLKPGLYYTMGFDNECIPNIQSLAGEYFCPVCRLLVYPNEALQSQCTHLYCKACLTYIVSTTRACPYDGYLVTEADSKLLIESNKALAETIGKITVQCLYQRSGCTWQGNLSECTSHCSGCAFGNSPVVCNRCGIQIIHRQVQEHAQTCPGVQPQGQNVESAQNVTTTSTTTNSEHTQAITLPRTSTTQTHTSQTTITLQPGQDPSLQATTKAQAVVSAVVPTAEPWYQQQQQYQQYYQQQYAAYQQHYYQYYPNQQQAIPQYQQSQVYVQPQISQVQVQPNLQVQPQAQLQTQPQLPAPIQLPVAAQPLNQALVNPQQQTHAVSQPQSQIQPTVQLPTHGYSHPQSQPHLQNQPAQPYPQPAQVPQYQQPHVQMQQAQPQIQPQAHSQIQPQHIPVLQPQSHLQSQPLMHAQHPPQPLSQPLSSQPNQPLIPNLLPQSQNPSANAVTDHHSYTQLQPGAPQHPLHMHLQSGPRPQLQHSIQAQAQYPQQLPLLRPPQSHATIQNLQQPGLLPSSGQVPSAHPAQQQPGPYAHQPGVHVHQLPAQQPMHQQPFSGQPLAPVQNQGNQQVPFIQQQLHGQSQWRLQGPQQPFQQNSQGYQQPQHSFSLPNSIQRHQAQSLPGWTTMPHGVSTQPHLQSPFGMQLRPGQIGGNQQAGNILRTNGQVQSSSEQLSGVTSRPISERHDQNDEKGAEADLSSHHAAKRDKNGSVVASDLGADGGEMKRESEVKLEDVLNEPIGETKDSPKPLAVDNGGLKLNMVKEEPRESTVHQKDVSDIDKELLVTEEKEMKDVPLLKTPLLQEGEHHERQGMKLLKEQKLVNQSYGGFPPHGQEQEEGLRQSSHFVPAVSRGWQNHPSYHGPLDLQRGPVGPPLLQAPSPGLPYHATLPEHPSTQLRPLGPGRTAFSGQSLNPLAEYPQHPGYRHTGPPPQGPYTQGHALLSQGEQSLLYREAEMFPHQRLGYIDGRRADSSGQQSTMLGLRDRGHQAFPNERLNPFSQDSSPGNIAQEELEGDLKHFTRPSHLDADTVPAFRGERPVPGYVHRHRDGLGPRSPGGDFPGLPSHRFSAFPHLDNIDGRELRRFESINSSFHDSRFPTLPGHLHMGEYDGPGNLRRGEHLSGSQDGLHNHLQRAEHLGPHDLPRHLRLDGFIAAFPGHARIGDFSRRVHPRLGEPGFRCNYSLKGFPADGGSYAGDFESYDNSRKRRPSSMGWCRICKVDCETVEGLDLHSQTREHQKMAMDIVLSIKQNAKKQRFDSSSLASLDDEGKPKNGSSEDNGSKQLLSR
uniref:RING-type domain-containing protein n=1 Tax=Rhizophora mucronata TaxID=61149 RepID=A0A2P2KQF4_RHIMU